MKNYLVRNLNFAELRAKPYFFWKIPNFIKSERFNKFFPNSIPKVLDLFGAVIDIFQKIQIVIKSQSMNQFQRKWYQRKGRIYLHIKFQLDRPSNSWDAEAWSLNTDTHIHPDIFPKSLFWTFHIILSVLTWKSPNKKIIHENNTSLVREQKLFIK